MKGMLIKDFSLLKGAKQFFLVACIFAFIMLFFTDQYYFGISYLIIMFVMFTLSTIAYDEYDNGLPFLFTLPITRKVYVKEKYIFSLLMAVMTWVVSILLILILFVVKGNGKEEMLTLFLTSAAALAAGMMMTVVMLPLQFKFGSEKRQMALIAGFAVVFLCIFGGIRLVDRFGMPGVFLKLSELSMGGVIAIVAVIVVALMIGSYLISVRIMEKKEL